jgi:hypothetical protein
MSLPSLSEVYARWHNANHGFEKDPDINYSKGINNKGMLDHCIFLFVLKAKGMHRPEVFYTAYHDINRLCSEKTGVFYSNIYEKYEKAQDVDNNIVENYIGISLASIMGLYFSIPRNISFRLKKSLAAPSLSGKINLIPFSFPNIAILLYCAGDTILGKVFYPFFYFCAIFYSLFVNKFVEKKIIYFIFLHNLKYKKELTFLYNFYVRQLTKIYGENFLNILLNKYYENKNHPSILYSKDVTFKEVITWNQK